MKQLHQVLTSLEHSYKTRPELELDDLKMYNNENMQNFGDFPFVSAKIAHFERLEEEIYMYMRWAVLTPDEHAKRYDFIKELQRLIDGIEPGFKAVIFGSQASQTASYFSDIDVCIDGFPVKYRSALVRALQTMAPGANYIANAKVPIIQGVFRTCNIDFDISFEHSAAISRDTVLQKQLNPHARALLMLMKAYLRQRNLHTPHIGGLSGHLLLQLILALVYNRGHYFSYKVSEKWPTVAYLLEFLQFYGYMFNYDKLFIYKAQTGRYSFQRRGNEIYREKVQKSGPRPILCIVVGDRDIAGGVYNYRYISEGFDMSYLQLIQCCTQGYSILGKIIGIDKIGLTTRTIITQAGLPACVDISDSEENTMHQANEV